MITPLLEAQHVSRIFEHGFTPVRALRDVSCKVYPGDRVAVVGASGSGKSTLLHLMGGLDAPTQGTLIWPALGAREDLRPEKVALVFQTQSLIPSLSVLENVELPLLLGHATLGAREAALAALAWIDLLDLADKLPEELSGGQAQRVAVARALAYRPALILMDEPTGQLDHPTAQHLFDVLLKALEHTDIALVVATHDRGVAARMRRVWRMAYGRLETQPSVGETSTVKGERRGETYDRSVA